MNNRTWMSKSKYGLQRGCCGVIQCYLLWGGALGSVWLTGLLLGVCCTGVWVVDDPLTSTWLVAFLPTADGVDKQGGRGLDSTWREREREKVNGKSAVLLSVVQIWVQYLHRPQKNNLPTRIRNAGSLSIFKQQLKTHLFRHYLTSS